MKLSFFLFFVLLSGSVFSTPAAPESQYERSLFCGSWENKEHVKFVIEELKLPVYRISLDKIFAILAMLTSKAKHMPEVQIFFHQYFFNDSFFSERIFHELFQSTYRSGSICAPRRDQFFELVTNWLDEIPDDSSSTWTVLLSKIESVSFGTQVSLDRSKKFEGIISRIKAMNDENFSNIIELYLKFCRTFNKEIFNSIGFERVYSLKEDSVFSKATAAIFLFGKKIPLEIFENLDFERINKLDDQNFSKILCQVFNSDQIVPSNILERLNLRRISTLTEESSVLDVSDAIFNSDQTISLSVFEDIVKAVNAIKDPYSFAQIICKLCNSWNAIPSSILENFNFNKINNLKNDFFL